MSAPVADPTPDPAAGFVTKVRWLMALSGLTTLIAIAAVLGVVGYRVFRTDSPVVSNDVTTLLPSGARVVGISAAADRIVVTIDRGGSLEARLFDARTLRPAGILRFANEP
jgi:hypothetical protein